MKNKININHMRIRISAYLLISMFLTTSFSFGQNSSASSKSSLIFRTLGADCSPGGLNYLSGSNVIALPIQQGSRSQPLSYAGPSPMILFRNVTGKDGKTKQVPVVSVDFNQSGSYPLLVFFKSKNGTDVPLITILKEDAKSYPAGTFRLVNYSTNALLASLPSGPVQVLPSSIKDYAGKDGGVFNIGISEVGPTGKTLIFNSNVGILPGSRIMFLITPSSAVGGHVQIQDLPDSVPSH